MSKSKLFTLTIFTYVLLLPVFLSAGTFKLPDTSQTKCYRGVDPYDEIPCADTGQDGAYNINPMSFTDNGNGTVTDNNTGLMWQQQDDGNTYNWFQASGTYDATYNPTSMNVCSESSTGGYYDWRLPSKKELISIVNYSISFPGPTIDPIFTNTKQFYYWSSTISALGPDNVWNVDFSFGYSSSRYIYKAFSMYVRCVRGGSYPSQSFLNNNDGTITDSDTGLVWQQGEPGTMTWDLALSYCEGLTLGDQTDWRLPNIKELESLTDDTRYVPAIDTTFFPNAYVDNYWSSTTHASNPDVAWLVGFYDGGLNYYYPKYRNMYVRCVCGGQSGEVTSNLEVSPSSHDFGETAVGTCLYPQQFMLSNTGNADLNVSDITLSDNTNFELSINALQCEKAIQPGGSCSFDVYFCPKTSGSLSANLTITSDDPDSPTFEVPITGTGISTTNGWLVVIDGMHIISILNPDYRPGPTDYLKEAIDLAGETDSIQQDVGTIWPFSWSNNVYDTEDAVSKLSQLLEELTSLNKITNAPLVVLSHSWGTVLAYIAISKNNDISVDKLITLGSPLGSIDPIIKPYTLSWLLKSGIYSLIKPSNVKEWHNYWALCDAISGKIPSADKNNRVKTFSLIPSNLFECHPCYFNEKRIWRKILADILKN